MQFISHATAEFLKIDAFQNEEKQRECDLEELREKNNSNDLGAFFPIA